MYDELLNNIIMFKQTEHKPNQDLKSNESETLTKQKHINLINNLTEILNS